MSFEDERGEDKFFHLLNLSNKTTTREDLIRYILQQKITLWHLWNFMFGMRIFYSFLFIFGMLGHLWVLCVVGYILKVLRGVIQNPNLFIYILCMSMVDVLVLLSLPMLVTNMYFFQWIFGRCLCKVYWIVESINKMLSTFVLCALSCERYLTICHTNWKCGMRNTEGTVKLIGILIILVVVLLIPVYFYADEYWSPEYFIVKNETFSVKIQGCNLVMTHVILLGFTVYIFCVGFCAPAFLITYFYVRILYKMYSHTSTSRNRVNTQVPVRRVTCTIFAIVVFYLVCWGPYWGITLFSIIVPDQMNDVNGVQLMHILHSLVYVKSAFNWLPYSFLNKQLRECRKLAIKRNKQKKLMSDICLNDVTAHDQMRNQIKDNSV